jgi:hypothetical protein
MIEAGQSKTTRPIMKKTVKISLYIVLFFILSSVAFYSWSFYSFDLCGNTIEKEVYSPNHLKRAVVFERDCGAATGFSTQVSILDCSDKLPNEGGNTLVSADVLHFGSGHDIYWKSENELVIEYNFRADIRVKEDFANGVKIIYKDSMVM